jgi:LytR cell envelope-related transcriptional attenuator
MTLTRRLLIGALLAATAGVGVALWLARSRPAPVRPTPLARLVTKKEITAPPSARVRVEIINATKTRGLARRATRLLRDRGFDVVTYTTSDRTQDSTVVLDRSNHLEWARLVGEALGATRVEARPDSSRYVDVTVVLGVAWRPPPQPFSP